jgi:hypothetical protein
MEIHMKVTLTTALFALLFATGSAFAQDLLKATTQADCEKAGGAWNLQSNECAEESAKMGEDEGTHEGANLGTASEHDTQKVDQPPRRDPTTGN